MGARKTIQRRLGRIRWAKLNPGSVAKAAEFLRLDPNDAGQREKLLHLLAEAIFGPPGKGGRPRGTQTSWGNRLFLLGRIYEKKKRENPKLSDAKIAKLIKDEHREFKHDQPDQIRQRLRVAHEKYEWACEEASDYLEPPEDWEPPEPDYDDYDD
ncbi:MAG: hypothetical protein WAV38_27400 [Xanthobacteraceae bacterium]